MTKAQVKEKPSEVKADALKLSSPIDLGEERISELRFEPAKGADFWHIKASEPNVRALILIALSMAGHTGSRAERIGCSLGSADLAELQRRWDRAVDEFQEGGQAVLPLAETLDGAPLEFNLRHAIDWPGEPITQLVWKPLTGRAIWDMPADPSHGDLFAIAAAQCGVDIAALRRLSAFDAGAVHTLVLAYLKPFQGTGG